jgi:hypothetical protein
VRLGPRPPFFQSLKGGPPFSQGERRLMIRLCAADEAEATYLHPVVLAYVVVSIRVAWPVAKALQLIVFGSLSNPFADRISVAD